MKTDSEEIEIFENSMKTDSEEIEIFESSKKKTDTREKKLLYKQWYRRHVKTNHEGMIDVCNSKATDVSEAEATEKEAPLLKNDKNDSIKPLEELSIEEWKKTRIY